MARDYNPSIKSGHGFTLSNLSSLDAMVRNHFLKGDDKPFKVKQKPFCMMNNCKDGCVDNYLTKCGVID